MVGKPTNDNKVQLEVESTTYYKGTLSADDSYTYSNEAEGTPVASFFNRYDASLPENTTFTLTDEDNSDTILHATNKDGMFTFNVNLNPVQTTYTELLAQAAQPADNSEETSSAPAEIQTLLERRYILAETAPAATAPAATATPTSVIPRTADSFPLALLIGLAIVSCGALVILYTAKKRRK